jgi:hypothetical protein
MGEFFCFFFFLELGGNEHEPTLCSLLHECSFRFFKCLRLWLLCRWVCCREFGGVMWLRQAHSLGKR